VKAAAIAHITPEKRRRVYQTKVSNAPSAPPAVVLTTHAFVHELLPTYADTNV
jgi:hypothetical protein